MTEKNGDCFLLQIGTQCRVMGTEGEGGDSRRLVPWTLKGAEEELQRQALQPRKQGEGQQARGLPWASCYMHKGKL